MNDDPEFFSHVKVNGHGTSVLGISYNDRKSMTDMQVWRLVILPDGEHHLEVQMSGRQDMTLRLDDSQLQTIKRALEAIE